MEISSSPIVAVPEGKILDFITKRLVNDNPEEYVRQNIEKALVRQYKYPIDDCEPEFSIKVGSSNKRVDVVVFEAGGHHKQENAFILVETKKSEDKSSWQKGWYRAIKVLYGGLS